MSSAPGPLPSVAERAWLRRFAALVAGLTFLLVCAGALVTSTGSGLSVPDWPLSFGQVFPPMRGGVLLEHGHRMVAATVGLATVILAIWLWRKEPRRWVRGLGVAALLGVLAQGVLGGVTVLLRLPTAVSVGHAGLAQIFFALTVTLAVVTGPAWARGEGARSADPDSGTPSLHAFAAATTGAVYLQILLGALVRHSGAGLAIPDFPLAFGRLLPPPGAPAPVWLHFAHRVGALAVAVLVLGTVSRVLAVHRARGELRRPALLLLVLLAWQIFLGALTVWTRKAVVPTSAHVAVGSLLLGTSLLLALRAHRLLAPRGPELLALAAAGGSAPEAGARLDRGAP